MALRLKSLSQVPRLVASCACGVCASFTTKTVPLARLALELRKRIDPP